MIRREDLAPHPAECGTGAVCGNVADRVKRGESVRIVGLGTLALYRLESCPPKDSYRLTLTTAEGKGLAGRMAPFPTGDREIALYEDTKHLARALGAPVEVHGTARVNAAGEGSTLVTTVQP